MDRPVELGRATTRGQALPLGIDDPVVAARAVRRALAAAGRRAAEVETLVVASAEGITSTMLASFARRALGPHGATVACRSIECRDEEAGVLAARAAEDVAASHASDAGLAITIGLSLDGTTEARVLAIGSGSGTGRAPAAQS